MRGLSEVILFTLIVAIASIFSVLSKSGKIKVMTSVGKATTFTILLLFSLLVGSIYIERWLMFSDLGTLMILDYNITQFHINILPLTSALALLGVFLFVAFRLSPKVKRDSYLSSKMKELYHSEEYGVLADIITQFYDNLIAHPDKPRKITPISYRGALEPIILEKVVIDEEDYKLSKKEKAKIWARKKERDLRYYYRLSKYRVLTTSEKSSSYTKKILLSADFGSEHPVIKPEMGKKIILDSSLNNKFREDFLEVYLESLVKTENSVLYRELYDYDSGIGLIDSLLEDIEEKRKVYSLSSPVGEPVKQFLRDRKKLNYDDYNDYVGFNEKESKEYREPVQTGIKYFDRLVRKAFEQEIKFVWIKYYESFTKIICENYELTEHSGPEAEHPNYYSSLIYEMFDNLLKWIELVRDVEGEPEHIQIPDKRDSFTIPEESVTILFNCHREVINTEEIPYQFKRYLTEMIFSQFTQLRQYSEESIERKYSDLMISELEENINEDEKYREQILRMYRIRGGVRNLSLRDDPIVIKDEQLTGLSEEMDDILDL